MDADRWEHLTKLFEQALALAPAERMAFLDDACAGDDALRRELDALLHSHDDARLYFDDLASSVFNGPAAPAEAPRRVGPYEVVGTLGAGGMGLVYKAHDPRLGRYVALKFLPPALGRDPDARARFLQEARAASALDHENICTIYDVGETDDGQAFIAMACYEGETLKTRLAHGPVPPAEALGYLRQAARGLAKAHEAGIVHRDVKPANLMITRDGKLKILDFGIAKAGASALTQPGTRMGTAAYMSPEQVRGEPVDARTDVWSLGVVLYEMLAGRKPFVADYPQALLYQVLHEVPPPLPTDALPAGLAYVLWRTLEKDPGRRYADGRALLTALDGETATTILAPAAPATPSIAVLPFRNLSPDPENEYFSDGLAESILNALTQVKSLRVMARTSAFAFKERNLDLREVGRRLGVGSVLDGSVQKAGQRLRITAQLVDVGEGFHVWSERYDRVLDDVFAIQDEITLAIVEKLKIELLSGEHSALVRRHTADPEAYRLYLKARYFWNRRHEGGLQKSLAYLQQAIAKDPAYALAHAGLADSYNILAFWSFLDPATGFALARAAAEQALALDDDLAEAHAALAFALVSFDRAWDEAGRRYERALTLNPGYASAYTWYAATYLAPLGRFEEAQAACRRAEDLDPLSLIVNAISGIVFYLGGHLDRAEAQLLKTLEMEPRFLLAHVWLGLTYDGLERYDEAVTVFERAVQISSSSTIATGLLGAACAAAGQHERARTLLAELATRAASRYVPPVYAASIHARLGEPEAALDRLDEAIATHDPFSMYLKMLTPLAPLRGHPRFAALVERVGLPL